MEQTETMQLVSYINHMYSAISALHYTCGVHVMRLWYTTLHVLKLSELNYHFHGEHGEHVQVLPKHVWVSVGPGTVIAVNKQIVLQQCNMEQPLWTSVV